MEDRLNRRSTPFFIKQEDSTGTPPDNAADSPFSGDEAAEVNMPSPRKRFVNYSFFFFVEKMNLKIFYG